MTQSVVHSDSKSVLRVAVLTHDTLRRTELQRLVVEAGYDLVGSAEAAQVLVVEGNVEVPDQPAVTLGMSDVDQAGALPAEANAQQLDAAIRAVAAGLLVRAPRHGAGGFDALHARRSHALLTPREVDILTAISAGLSNKAIAKRLAISQHTVKFHVESLLKKLGARTRAEAVAKGLERRREETVEL